jgi:AraC family transcriptional regulator
MDTNAFSDSHSSRALTAGLQRTRMHGPDVAIPDRSSYLACLENPRSAGRSRVRLANVSPSVEIWPHDSIKRRTAKWPGVSAEIVQVTRLGTVSIRFQGPVHLVAAHDHGVRRAGKTILEGVAQSSLQQLKRRLTVVPAGCKYTEWYDPHVLPRITYIYLDPSYGSDGGQNGVSRVTLAPRLFFQDPILWDTVSKLNALIDTSDIADRLYLEAVGGVLVHELMRSNDGVQSPAIRQRGGLAAWQEHILVEYIEEHLDELPALAMLAALVHLSPHHLCRAFKQTLGQPPCRYHGLRRIERAKLLLADTGLTVTEIALMLGFSETSSFTTAFRRTTGLAPTDYRRSLA